MAKSVYIVAPDSLLGKSAIAFGALEALRGAFPRVGVFRPIISTNSVDQILESLLPAATADQEYDQAYGVTYARVREDRDGAITDIIGRYQQVAAACDVVVIVGSDYSDVINPIEFSLNAEIAANLNTPALLVLEGNESPDDLRYAADFCLAELRKRHAAPMGVIGVNIDPEDAVNYRKALDCHGIDWTLAIPGRVSSEVVLPDAFVDAVQAAESNVCTPLRFQYELMTRAGADLRTVVLPEADDDRILTSAAIIKQRGIANLILLGDEATILARADELGLDLSGVTIQNPDEPELLGTFAEEYAKLRAKKGVTVEQARETLKDLSYFGTMMIHFGLADGMVSGAVHTTANTIRPALEFIKTKPGAAIVSGYFLMCLSDRVYVFADCAVNTNPTPDQLADIAIASAETARTFNIDPKVAILSYSTGTSGTGPDVDAAVEATRILRERAPELPSEGPIQFDAAVDPVVAKTKRPDSPVAGHATVFIFPSLNTGNTTYKAVQRTAKAIAIGPILQGLRKPVNDLSRGALVDDIVNTVAITAIQAQIEE
ncbi:MAG: phosphate acetyltransferase [Propionibacteriaceae bacterium]|jgi:phosphate acetyltransferase|nr:phosphate acetyltransferase [Propionibacteriaceae bacterium]